MPPQASLLLACALCWVWDLHAAAPANSVVTDGSPDNLPPLEQRYTIQIQTYKRPAYLEHVIRHLVHAPSLDQIVVIWNGEDRPNITFAGLPRPVRWVITGKNDVTSRWFRQAPTRTAAVFNMDDDTLIPLPQMEEAFKFWQAHQDRVVGFLDRSIYLDKRSKKYRYSFTGGVKSTEVYSMIAGKAWIAGSHVFNLTHQDDPLYQRISAFLHDPLHEAKGCDDIAWNYYLHWKGAKPPLALPYVNVADVHIQAQKKESGYSAQSHNVGRWRAYRDACIAGLHKVLGIKRPCLPRRTPNPKLLRSHRAKRLASLFF